VVDDETVVGGVDVEVRVQRRQPEMVDPQLLGPALQLAVIVGDAHRADVVALDEEHLDDGPPIPLQPFGAGATSTVVVHAGTSLVDPASSTTQSRQAPTSDRPSRWHSVGMSMPFSLATASTVSPPAPATSIPSILSV
jgi:hypothetical protein